jgi:hypothetical protein
MRLWLMAAVAMVLAPQPVWSQSAVWQPHGATTGNIYYNGGNVGIGTVNPSRPLEITNTAGSWNSVLSMFTDSSAPESGTGLLIQGLNGNNTRVNLGGFSAQVYNSTPGGEIGQVKIRSMAGGTLTEALTILGSNVGIGTTNPQYRLAVEGAIGARDIIVTNTPWSDYVFRPGYRLRPLSEVASFIRQHGHLPEIPSEAEVKQKGVSVADVQAKLLAKIEELTLHLIQQEKDNRELRGRLTRLETQTASGSAPDSTR